MRKRKKGLSPLISAVLLIVIAVSIAALVFSWINTFTISTERKVSNKTDEAVDCSGASISIKDVFLTNGTNGTVRVVVANTGYRENMTIQSGQVYNKTGHNFSADNTPVTLGKGELGNIIFSNVSVQQCANFSRVFIATKCGGIDDEFTGTPIGC